MSNFKSIYRKETILFKARNNKYKNKILKNDILPVVSIYGPNGGGKSSFIESIIFIKNFISSGNNVQHLDNHFKSLRIFKNHNKKDEISEWEFVFLLDDGTSFKYKICLSLNNIEYESLHKKEALNKKWETIFVKQNYEINLNEELLNTKIKIDNVNGSLFSYLYSYVKVDDIIISYNEFNKIIAMNSPSQLPSFQNMFTNQNIYNFDVNFLEEKKDIFLKIFNEIDLNIENFFLNKDDIFKNNSLYLVKKNEASTFFLDFNLESAGTKKIIQMLTFFVKGIMNGGYFWIDELDSQLHTKLLGYIINLFNSKNNSKSQLIFTSHDMGTLSKDYFRKDEIYFAALNENYFTDLIYLVDLDNETRGSDSLSKKYLNGCFGYDPYVKKCSKW